MFLGQNVLCVCVGMCCSVVSKLACSWGKLLSVCGNVLFCCEQLGLFLGQTVLSVCGNVLFCCEQLGLFLGQTVLCVCGNVVFCCEQIGLFLGQTGLYMGMCECTYSWLGTIPTFH